MDTLGLILLILLGGLIGSGVALWRSKRSTPPVEADPYVDERFSRLGSDFSPNGIELA